MIGHCPQDGGFIGDAGCTQRRLSITSESLPSRQRRARTSSTCSRLFRNGQEGRSEKVEDIAGYLLRAFRYWLLGPIPRRYRTFYHTPRTPRKGVSDMESKKHSRKPEASAKPKSRTTLQAICHKIFLFLKVVSTRQPESGIPLCPPVPFEEFVEMSALMRECEPLLLQLQEVQIAAMPTERLLDFLKYPLPEKAVRRLTELLSLHGEVAIAIRLPGGVPSRKSGEGNRVVLFAGPKTLACLYESILCS